MRRAIRTRIVSLAPSSSGAVIQRHRAPDRHKRSIMVRIRRLFSRRGDAAATDPPARERGSGPRPSAQADHPTGTSVEPAFADDTPTLGDQQTMSFFNGAGTT